VKIISLIEDRNAMHFASWLERYYFEKYILDVAIATLERGGVTSKVDTYQFLAPIDAWGFPKYPGRTRILDPGANIAEALVQFIEENSEYLREADTWLGTWMNPTTHNCHIDVTTISSGLEEARQEAIKRGRMERRAILAIYNFKYDETVFL
jgi:hypothetical protein